MIDSINSYSGFLAGLVGMLSMLWTVAFADKASSRKLTLSDLMIVDFDSKVAMTLGMMLEAFLIYLTIRTGSEELLERIDLSVYIALFGSILFFITPWLLNFGWIQGHKITIAGYFVLSFIYQIILSFKILEELGDIESILLFSIPMINIALTLFLLLRKPQKWYFEVVYSLGKISFLILLNFMYI